MHSHVTFVSYLSTSTKHMELLKKGSTLENYSAVVRHLCHVSVCREQDYITESLRNF